MNGKISCEFTNYFVLICEFVAKNPLSNFRKTLLLYGEGNFLDKLRNF